MIKDIHIPESVAVTSGIKSPFQLFSAFSEADKDKFFGREEETALLYQFVQESNVVLLYGESGTGKTSIVQCGLLNETKHFNWTSITIRRSEDINASLCKELTKYAGAEIAGKKDLGVTDLMQEVFLKNFQPILLVFDQFEEIFVFGNENERKALSNNIAQILGMRIPWKMVFVIREDFLAQLNVFEKDIPGIFKKKLRIELMDKSNCRNVILKSFKVFNIDISPIRKKDNGEPDTIYSATNPDAADKIINTATTSQGLIHLPYFQVFLDRLWKEAWAVDNEHVKIDEALIDKVNGMGDVLKAFLEEKVITQQILNKVDAWKFLKLFVPEKGTTRKKIKLTEYTAIPAQKLNDIVDYFLEYKILTGCSENSYELGHESLVPIIQGVKLNEIRPRLTTPTIQGNPYKGLASFDQSDNDRFYGRREAVNMLYEKITRQNFLVIVGNSGSGKSSLVKAGLFPLLKTDGYEILHPVRAGEKPLQSIEESLSATITATNKKFVLLIDQYEELITRINEKETRAAVYNKIFDLLEKQKNKTAGYILKIIVTVRADFEPQFRIAAPLNLYWSEGKYIVPPFTREEIREVIEEPAYQAGLEFSPPSLVEAIAEEVYSSQATGLLPLMSFTLNALYEKYKEKKAGNNLLLEKDYNELGGVIGGLQNRAEKIYNQFKESHPSSYKQYQDMMQNIILRMIYLSTGELAGQRLLEDDLIYKDESTNAIKDEILSELLNSKLIISGKDNKKNTYYEPAHDVLVRSWGQIWDWIGQIGKEKLFLRSRLTQAVNDYNNSNKGEKLLWNNSPWLDDLVPQIETENCWLNQKEIDFVIKSKEYRDKIKEREEQSRISEEKILEQKKEIKRSRNVRIILLIAFLVAAISGLIALYQWARAARNFDNANQQSKTVENLNTVLSTRNDSLHKVQDKLKDLIATLNIAKDSISALANLERFSAAKAQNAAIYAFQQRQLALTSVEDLKTQVSIRQAAEALARERGDSLAQNLAKLLLFQRQIDSINRILFSKNRILDSLNLSLQNQNASQLVSISKSLEKADIVKAYRVAELALQKDSSSSDVVAQFRRLSSAPAYYYLKEFKGDLSSYSPDGAYILTISYADHSIKLIQNGPYKILDSLAVKDELISAVFSPGSQSIMITYKNKVEIYKVNNLHIKRPLVIDEKNIFSAKYSPDETKILVLTKDHLLIYDSYSAKFIQSIKDKDKNPVINAVFSEDGHRVIYGMEDGTINVYDVGPGKSLKTKLPKTIVNSYISPKGNCFIVTAPDNFYLYNSNGNEKSVPNLQKKYGQLKSAIFSDDGKKILLSFNSVSPKTAFQPQQKGEYNEDTKTVILIDADDPYNINTNLASLIDAEDLSLFTSGYSNMVIKNNSLFSLSDHGNIKLLNLNTGDKKELTGHQKLVNSISMFNGYILTSANDNSTKVWQYNTALALDKLKLLPGLSAQELIEFGAK